MTGELKATDNRFYHVDRQWTKARKLALEALFINDGKARRSNSTNARVVKLTETSTTTPLVYWQSADWLLNQGLVEPVSGHFDMLQLTVAGWEEGRRLWNVPQRTLDRMMRKARAS